MKKTMSANRLNRILRLVIVILVLALVVYGIKCRVDTSKMKVALTDAQQKVEKQTQENEEVNHFLQNSDYYLEQQARGSSDYSDPEEKVFVVVP